MQDFGVSLAYKLLTLKNEEMKLYNFALVLFQVRVAPHGRFEAVTQSRLKLYAVDSNS